MTQLHSMLAKDLFSPVDDWPFAEWFSLDVAPWLWLERLEHALDERLPALPNNSPVIPPGLEVRGFVVFGENVKLPPFGSIQGPAYIGDGTELRPGVYIRGNVVTGKNCVLGNSCEFKNAILLDDVNVPHFSYVGDSILGNRAHLGAGAICSNLRLDQAEVRVRLEDGSRHATGRRKLGLIAGDGAEVGSNAVLNPGSILMPGAIVGPGLSFTGTLPAGILRLKRTATVDCRR